MTLFLSALRSIDRGHEIAARLYRLLYKSARAVYRALPLKRQWRLWLDKFVSRHVPFLIPVPSIPRPRRRRFSGVEQDWLHEFYEDVSDGYEAVSISPVPHSEIKLIAFYLPQFHPIPENDRWWGKGFTEWTNVTRAKPQFPGHYQPHLPGELGFYDLRLVDVQKRQIELAKHYGIYGFCYYYYWFNGKRLLDLPLKQVLVNPDLDLPFCICWANENWTRRWDGQEQEVLLGQQHSPENDFKFIEDVTPILKDKRYIKIANKPLLIVYRPDILSDTKATVLRWRNYCIQTGVGDIYLIAARTFGFENPIALGFDAAVEFPPHGITAYDITDEVPLLNPSFQGRIFSYQDMVEKSRVFSIQTYPVFRTVIPTWDNTARRASRAHIFRGSSPRLYQTWLEAVCDYSIHHFAEPNRLVFVNAWNEWAEGTHLEPDRRYGYAYLNATANVLRKYRRIEAKKTPASNSGRPSISVVIPSYNHEQYIRRALESLRTQTTKDFEVIVVDDGSTDCTAVTVEEYFSQNKAELNIQLVNQENAGAHAAINRGIEEAKGEYVAILNSDDFYHPERLASLVEVLKNSGSLLAFSDVEVVGEDGRPLYSKHPYAALIRAKLSQVDGFQGIGYALLDFNVTITTGNLFFRRELFDLAGGFSDLKYCHDWDFALTALQYTSPVFVKRRLYYYRLHGENSFLDLQHLAEGETRAVLTKFFAFEQSQAQVRRGCPSHKIDGQYFSQFVKERGYEKYIREAVQV